MLELAGMECTNFIGFLIKYEDYIETHELFKSELCSSHNYLLFIAEDKKVGYADIETP